MTVRAAIGLRVVVADQGTTSTIQLDDACDLAHQQRVRDTASEVLDRRPVLTRRPLERTCVW